MSTKHSRAEIETGRLWREEGERREGTIADVAPLVPVFRTYSFAVPPEWEGSVSVGQRVTVPVGRTGRPVTAFVLALDRRPWNATLRPIKGIIDAASFLSPALIELAREISVHYACPLGATLKAMTPESVRRESGLKTVRHVELVSRDASIPLGVRMTESRRAVLDILFASDASVPLNALRAETNASDAVLRALVRAGAIRIIKTKEVADDEVAPNECHEPEFQLNADQQAACDRIVAALDAGRFGVSLLFGVSGSGKTEVYIRSIQHALQRGQQAIFLVPEIVLTTQLVARLAQRFPRVAVAHSGLSESRRAVMWRQIVAGHAPVVIGTRSAVFAPCPNLGLICVDEEQEPSFKNLQAPRFHVRDVAIMRAKGLGIPIVLGSATPSVETWHHSEHRKDYQRLSLPRRVRDLPMPKVHLIDMRDEWTEQRQAAVFSRTLERLLGESLSRGEQAVLLMNRRGFARRLFCDACRSAVACPNCNTPYVIHSTTNEAVCHYCRSRIPSPKVCPNVTCGRSLIALGTGTQRVEEELRLRCPAARIERVDSDTMAHRRDYERVVGDFTARRVDVLVGTQMIAKGLDFPFVSFVGVLHADGAGMTADFRANERLFQLITQVAGRAGRADASGQVVVQTTTPELPALRHALRHDYESFAREELTARSHVGWPPFRRLARVIVSHAREQVARKEAESLVVSAREAIAAIPLADASVEGPTSCAMARVRGRYRFEVLVRAVSAFDLRRLTTHWLGERGLRTRAESAIVDVDPVSFT